MLSDATLNRVSASYARGYRDGAAGRPPAPPGNGLATLMSDEIGADPIRPFATFDYEAGYKAGAKDANPPKPELTEAQIERTIAVRAGTNAWRAAHGKPLLPTFTREELLAAHATAVSR